METYKRFHRGKQQIMMVVSIMLLMNGLSFFVSRTLLFSWYHDALAQASQLDVLEIQKILARLVPIDQRTFLASQAISYAFLMLCCVILCLGYSWIRWLWGISWFVKGATGAFAATLLLLHFGLWSNLVLFGFLTSLLYLVCAACLLCSPSVHTYMRMMRH